MYLVGKLTRIFVLNLMQKQIHIGKITCECCHLHWIRQEEPYVLRNVSAIVPKVQTMAVLYPFKEMACQPIDFSQLLEWWRERFCCIVINQGKTKSLLKLAHAHTCYLWYAWKLITVWIYSTQREASESQFAVHWINVSYWFLWLSTSEVMPCLLLIRGGTAQYIIKCN